MGSAVKAEFGPTLPELLGSRFGVSVRTSGIVAGALVAVVLGLGVAKHEQGDGTVRATVAGAGAFNLRYDPGKLVRAAPRPGETLRLQTKPGDRSAASVAVRPVTLTPYRGDDPSVALPIFLTSVVAAMERADPHFVELSESPARVNSQPGYQIQYLTRIDGRLWFGRRVFLFPDPREQPGARQGADVSLLAAQSKVVANRDEVGSNGPTKIPYRSFRLGAVAP